MQRSSRIQCVAFLLTVTMLLVAGFFALHIESARADTIRVCPTCDHKTIGEANADARSGDIIWVEPGEYLEAYRIYVKMGVTIKSAEGPQNTVIRPASINVLFVITGQEGSPARVLEGFTIIADPAQGHTERGGAIYIGNKARPIVVNNVFSGCVTTQRGGAICIEEADTQPVIMNNTFINNSISGFGAIGGGAIGIKDAAPVITSNLFINNHSDKHGGAIYLENDIAPLEQASIINNRFSGNIASNNGGAIYVQNARPLLQDNTFLSNTTYYNGGAIYLLESRPLLEGNTVLSNTALGGSGGGIYLNSPMDAMLQNNLIAHNTAVGNSPYSVGGGVAVWNAKHITVDSNVIRQNVARQGDGIYVENASTGTVTVTNNVFSGNGQYELMVKQGSPCIVNNTILGTSHTTNTVGIELLDSSRPRIVNNIIVLEKYGLRADRTSAPTVLYNDVWGNWAANYVSITPDATNRSVDPRLRDAANGDYQLQAESPLIDAGSNTDAPSHDLYGDPRPVDGNGDGSAIADIGADEYIARSATETPTPTPTAILTSTPTATPTANETPTGTSTATPTPTSTPTNISTATPTRTRTPASSIYSIYLPIIWKR